MSLRSIFLATLLGVTSAQQSTFSIPFYGYDTQSIVASVIGVSDGATTMQLACPSGTDGNDCGLFPSQTLIYGPSTYHMDESEGTETAAFIGTQDCSRAGTASAICTESNGGSEANFPGMSTTTYAGSEIAVLPVTVTAGSEKLTAGAGAAGSSAPASASATATGTSSLTMVSGTVSSTSGTGASSSAGSATGSAATTSSTGAAGSVSCASGSGFLAVAAGMLGCALLQ